MMLLLSAIFEFLISIFHIVHIHKCFVHSIFRFWFIATFDVKVTQILRNLYLHFVRQEGRKKKKNHTTKVTKIPKTKRREYGKQRNKNHLSE